MARGVQSDKRGAGCQARCRVSIGDMRVTRAVQGNKRGAGWA